MSILSSVSASDDFTGFSSAGGESTGRVIRAEQKSHSKSSYATLSCMKDSNEATTVVVPHKTERIASQRILCLGYNWVNSKVREFFSRYRSAQELCNFLSNSQIYSSNIDDDIISF